MTASKSDPEGFRIEDFVKEFLAVSNASPTIYEPREDSFLMLEALAQLHIGGLRVLDMGTGSGILAAYCAKRGADVTASDIDMDAIKALELTAERLGVSIRLVASDLFSNIQDSFDTIIFNPPYLQSSAIDDRAVDGGERGADITGRFLEDLARHLLDGGLALILVSSLNSPELLMARHPDLSFRVVRERSLFFERLFVLETSTKRTVLTHS